MPSRRRLNSETTAAIVRNVRSVLSLKHLTLSQVSQQSKVLYGERSPYFIPHNFYYDLRMGNLSLSIHQLVAFSSITGYRLDDWLRVFGANLEDIIRLQVALPSPRTIIIDSSLDDSYAWIPWFEDRAGNHSLPRIAPLGQLVTLTHPRRIRSLTAGGKSRFVYARIGSHDALAFPDLLPGSIVRVSTEIPNEILPLTSQVSSRYFLIEHSKGLFCCRVRAIGDRILVPVSSELSYAQVELQRFQETRLIGVADLEIRPLTHSVLPAVPAQLAQRWKPAPLLREQRIGSLLRNARATARLSLRQASAISRRIGDSLDNNGYSISPSSLCDYELLNTPPRRFHTVITLCSMYGLAFRTLLGAMGIDPDQVGSEPIPDALVHRETRVPLEQDLRGSDNRQEFVAQLMARCGEIPFFLRHSMEVLSGLKAVSLNDIFWIGGERDPLHPYLANGLLAVVNRRRRRPVHFPSIPVWRQPIYVVLKRDGRYLCACCGVEDHTLVLHPYSKDFHRADLFRYHHDAEVVGQVMTIARKLA